MQLLPYRVVTNEHMLQVHNLYEAAFDKFQRIPEVRTLEDNDKLCAIVSDMLKQHLTVIPSLVMGVIEVQKFMEPQKLDEFVATMLKSVCRLAYQVYTNSHQRISRRVIAEQHIANTNAFHQSTGGPSQHSTAGNVLRQIYPSQVVQKAADYTLKLMAKTYGHDIKLPKVNIIGDTKANFPYPVGHLEYVIGELLRNSIQATIEHTAGSNEQPAPIEVLIYQNPLQSIIRISDQGGGISPLVLDHLWSFSKAPSQSNRAKRLHNLEKVPKLAATMTDMDLSGFTPDSAAKGRGSLSGLSNRPLDLKLGIGLPMSKTYVEYWAGNLTVHNLEGYGTDAFVQVWKLGNKNEQILTRASMDAV
jgi:pyruvate dehydrogenase kinase 2/3/4